MSHSRTNPVAPATSTQSTTSDIVTVRGVNPLTVLHTSDWHLGRRLYGQMRYDEFAAFLDWLHATLVAKQVDVLIVAGDIFDTMTPSNRAQALYYQFLSNVSHSECQHVVVVAGNHDSPTFLDAPAQVLKSLNVHVVGSACDDINEEVLTLTDTGGQPLCVVSAVPYLRDRDVRGSQAGESFDTKDANVVQGIRQHYDTVANIAKARQRQLMQAYGLSHLPIIATGHLFAAGGKTTSDDGVRELYVGSLGKISADVFSTAFDYVALGHLHVPQMVGGQAHIRYCGSPIAMGFGEADQQKQVILLQFGQKLPDKQTLEPIPHQTKATSQSLASGHVADLFADLMPEATLVANADDPKTHATADMNIGASTAVNGTLDPSFSLDAECIDAKHLTITPLPVPCWQRLKRISGDLSDIEGDIAAISHLSDDPVWLEVTYTGAAVVANLTDHVQGLVTQSPHLVLKTSYPKKFDDALRQQRPDVMTNLQDLSVYDVFERCLTLHAVDDTQHDELKHAYARVVESIYDDDTHAQ